MLPNLEDILLAAEIRDELKGIVTLLDARLDAIRQLYLQQLASRQLSELDPALQDLLKERSPKDH